MPATWKKMLLDGDVGTNSKVKVSADDTTEGYLNGKIIAGTAIDLTEGSPGGNETLEIKVEADGITAGLIADDAVGSEHIEQLSAALDFGGQQAQDVVLHTVADATALLALTPVLGKIAWQTDTLHPYICIAVA